MGLIENLQIIKNEKDTKIIPENIKKDVQIFDIIGTLEGGGSSGGVKLFSTVEEMQADPDAHEGDLAVAYGNKIYPITANTSLYYVYIPKQVVLPEAITDVWYDVEDRETFSGIHLSGYRSRVYTYITVSVDERYQVEYISEDGLTYISNLEEDLIVKFNQLIPNDYPEHFNSNASYFIKEFVPEFNGFFEYKEDSDSYSYITNIRLDGETIIYDSDSKIPFDIMKYVGTYSDRYYICTIDSEDSEGNPTIISKYEEASHIGIKDNHIYILNGGGSLSTQETANIKHINLLTGEETIEQITTQPLILGGSTYQYIKDVTDMKWFDPPRSGASLMIYYDNGSSLIRSDYILQPKYYETKYWYADTQFTLNNSNQILPGLTALGSKGPITGDNSVYDNINYNDVWISSNLIPGEITSYTCGTIHPNKTAPIITYDFNSLGNDYIQMQAKSPNLYSGKIVPTDSNTFYSFHTSYYDELFIYECKYDNTGILSSTQVYNTSDTTIGCTSATYDGDSNKIYFVFNECNVYVNGHNINVLHIYEFDLSNYEVTELTNLSCNTNGATYVISPSKQAVYFDMFNSGFRKLTFNGDISTISSHSGYSSAISHSDKYIAVYDSSSKAVLYNINNESFTNIKTTTQNDFVLYTINDKTYLIEGSTMRVIQNDNVIKTVNIDFSYDPTITTLPDKADSNVSIPFITNNLVAINGCIIDIFKDTITYIPSLSNVVLLIYNNNKDIIYNTQYDYKYFKLHIDTKTDGTGSYMGYKYKDKDRNNISHIISKTEHQFIVENNLPPKI